MLKGLPSRVSTLLPESVLAGPSRHCSTSAPNSIPSSELPANYLEIAERIIDRRSQDISQKAAAAEKKRRGQAVYQRKRAASIRKPLAGNGLGPNVSLGDQRTGDPGVGAARQYATAIGRQNRTKPAASTPAPPVAYGKEKNPLSNDAKAFLSNSDSDNTGGGKDDMLAEFRPLSDIEMKKWKLADLGEGGSTLERGMVVECRRSGYQFLAVVLTALVGGGKLRYLMLPSSGEILPASAQDVHFIFPAGTVPKEPIKDITDHALSLELSGREGMDEMAMTKSREAKRKLGRSLRKVELEVDKRRRELGARGLLGPRAIWDHFTELSKVDNANELDVLKHVWTTVQLEHVSRHALGTPPSEPVSSLDAFVFHKTLMESPDLFQADDADMGKSQRFSLRPLAQVQILKEVEGWLRSYEMGLDKKNGASQEIQDFIRQARGAIHSHRGRMDYSQEGLDSDGGGLEPFSATSRMIISILRMRLAERRTTQSSPYAALAPAILKAIGLYGTDRVDVALLVKSLQEMGQLSEGDSLAAMRLRDTAVREGYPASTWERSTSPSPKTPSIEKADQHAALRRDFGDLPVYVIDDASASELDDGVSVERTGTEGVHWVHVHIADPTRWLTPGDDVTRLAARRGATLYVPEGTVPMLEADILMSQMSLGAASSGGQAVLTFSMKVDATGNILDFDVKPGRIHVVRKMTYHEAAEKLNAAGASDSVSRDLQTLSGVALSLKSQRSQHSLEWNQILGSILLQRSVHSYGGAAETGLPETTLSTPGSGNAAATAQSLVSELMIAANRVSGAFTAARDLPGCYRGADTPYISPSYLVPGQSIMQALNQLRESRDPLTGLVDPVEVAKLDMYNGKVPPSITPQDHFQLGVFAKDGGYQRSTSPLRRFSDMLIHWQIKQSLLTGKPMFGGEEMLRRAKALDLAETRVKRAEKASQQFWRSVYLGQRLAEGGLVNDGAINLLDLEAVVMAPTRFQTVERVSTTRVTLPQIGAPAVINIPGRSKEIMLVGQRLRVRMIEAKAWPAIITVMPT